MQRRTSCGNVAARDSVNGSRRDPMQSTVVRLLIGAGMIGAGPDLHGILAVRLEQRAEGRQPVGETCTPPKLERFRFVVRREE